MPRPQPGLTSPRPAYSPIPALSRSPVLSPVLGDGALDPYASWPLFMDFANNRYRLGVGAGRTSNWLTLPGASYTRTGEQLCYNAALGRWEVYAASTPPVMAGGGMEVDEGTTNKCTNYNAAPTDLTGLIKSGDAAATLTVVDDTAALRAAGFGTLIDAGKMNGNVYKLDNSAGSTNAFARTTANMGNTNPHAVSAFVRGSASTIDINVGSGVSVSFGASATYVRRSGSGTPTLDGPWRIKAGAGDVVYFILNQLEEKAYATNPVIVAGASASRGAATPVVTGLASLLTPPFTLVAVANLSAIDNRFRTLSQADDGTNTNRVLTTRGASNAGEAYMIGGTGSNPANFTGKSGPRVIKSAFRVRAATLALSFDGGTPTTSSISALPPGLAALLLGANRTSEYLNSPLLFAGIAPDLTDAQLQALTASYGLTLGFS